MASPKKTLAPQPTPIQRIASKGSFKEIIIETENEDKQEEPKKKEKEKEKEKEKDKDKEKEKDKDKDNIFTRKLKGLKKGKMGKKQTFF